MQKRDFEILPKFSETHVFRGTITEIVPFRFAEVAFLEKRSDSPLAMHISSISTSAFIETCDTSVVLKLQCLKMQACPVVIISVLKQLSNGYIYGVGTPPIPSPWVGHRPLN